MPSSPPPRARWFRLALLAGVVAGVAIVLSMLSRASAPAPFVERIATRAKADPKDVVAWTEQRERRAKPLEEIPDPPGDGPLVKASYWVSLPPYAMEIRRRGARATLAIHGVDAQVGGGGWTAFAEGTISGEAGSFRSAVARMTWSCVGLRNRRASMGVARLTFTADGRAFDAVYLQGAEALAIPTADTYIKAYGRIAELGKPAYGELKGQIPYTRAVARHAAGARIVVTGVVLAPDGNPIADAAVQLQGVDRTRVHTDVLGRFRVEFLGSDAPWTQSICAGAFGYRNGEAILFAGEATDGVVVELAPIDLDDHASYRWIHPAPDHDPEDVQACGTCHAWQYAEWSVSRHARMAENGHVLFERARMLKAASPAPDNCAACHEPGYAAQTGKGDYVPRGLTSTNHCDFCHKIRHTTDVRAPGVFGSLALARPDPLKRDRPGDIHRVFGTAPDVTYAYMGASYSPYLGTSFLCAGCHQGGGLAERPKIDTFEEWRRWAATREDDRFRSCQDCHMPAATTRNAEGQLFDLFAWETLHRSPKAVHAHSFAGSGPTFAKDALDVSVVKGASKGTHTLPVRVTLENRGAGHAIPTGTWTKHVAVGVYARVGDRWLAADRAAPRAMLGDAAPEGAALAAGDWRNPPGTVFGVYERASGRLAPDFWAPPDASDVDDRRLAPDAKVTLEVVFTLPDDVPPDVEPVVEVRVIHRRGPLAKGPSSVPWEPRRYDAPPEIEWLRVVR